jgi:hypothetical protein
MKNATTQVYDDYDRPLDLICKNWLAALEAQPAIEHVSINARYQKQFAAIYSARSMALERIKK